MGKLIDLLGAFRLNGPQMAFAGNYAFSSRANLDLKRGGARAMYSDCDCDCDCQGTDCSECGGGDCSDCNCTSDTND